MSKHIFFVNSPSKQYLASLFNGGKHLGETPSGRRRRLLPKTY
ncbi:Uncharacterised protein [Slackia heliotrinireducens]|nr:Uncharacterised protein [Slackia heliotrinireducens]